MKINKTLGFSFATLSFLALGYFGVQQLGRNNMFTIAATVGGAGAISYVLPSYLISISGLETQAQ